ncbi:hypothetical protein N7G274_007766 [Stereocaulon virgatum]|uniref:FAD/NAD(P)-binding domain-containing protein n=1 Tax=Stereocaulon virgatum TaxID=373712 RepID=A0ABR4A0M4_9LECA
MSAIRQFARLPAPLIDYIVHKSHATIPSLPRIFSTSYQQKGSLSLETLDASKGDRERIVILGSGWAGYILSQRLSAKYQTLVISPRSYFVFTPLLSSTAVGTLEFRTALEPIRSKRKPNIEFMQGCADNMDFGRKTVTVEESVVDHQQGRAMRGDKNKESETSGQVTSVKEARRREGKRWEISYDKLVIAVGCYSQTFSTPGIRENAFFMKDIVDARRIRKRVLECFEIANLPTTSEQLRKYLLTFAVVGGGPTGMEFAAELSDLVREDLTKLYPELVPKVNIVVRDVAPTVLSMFDEKLSQYAMETFSRQGVEVKTSNHVQNLRPGLPSTDGSEELDIAGAQGCYTLTTKEDGDVGVGICVWSTGNMMNPFVQKALGKTYGFPSESATITSGKPFKELDANEWMIEKHPKTGAITVDDRLRVQLHTKPQPPSNSASDSNSSSPPSTPTSTAALSNVFALGDNATIRSTPLPATAQTASQQALWLAKRLNQNDLDREHFTFKNLGMMTYLGNWKGLVQTDGVMGDISGRMAWLIWRGAYLTMSVSWRNKILIPVYWFLTWAFGRDVTRF